MVHSVSDSGIENIAYVNKATIAAAIKQQNVPPIIFNTSIAAPYCLEFSFANLFFISSGDTVLIFNTSMLFSP